MKGFYMSMKKAIFMIGGAALFVCFSALVILNYDKYTAFTVTMNNFVFHWFDVTWKAIIQLIKSF